MKNKKEYYFNNNERRELIKIIERFKKLMNTPGFDEYLLKEVK